MCPPNLLGHKRGPGGAVENTALGLTPLGESIDVDIDPPDGNASQSHLSQSVLGTREPLVVGVVEFVAIRRQLSKTKPLFSSVPSEPSDHFTLAHVYLVIRLTRTLSGRGERMRASGPLQREVRCRGCIHSHAPTPREKDRGSQGGQAVERAHGQGSTNAARNVPNPVAARRHPRR